LRLPLAIALSNDGRLFYRAFMLRGGNWFCGKFLTRMPVRHQQQGVAMLATLTSKGQVTLPKEIRDRLGLDAGSTLDFELMADGTITVRAIKPMRFTCAGCCSRPTRRRCRSRTWTPASPRSFAASTRRPSGDRAGHHVKK
jgi:AbrB family looped-hinge helix DNA binding protein